MVLMYKVNDAFQQCAERPNFIWSIGYGEVDVREAICHVNKYEKSMIINV